MEDTLNISCIGQAQEVHIRTNRKITILTGGNGSGKTTVARIWAGLLGGERQFLRNHAGEPYYAIGELSDMITTGHATATASIGTRQFSVKSSKSTITASSVQLPLFYGTEEWSRLPYKRRMQLLEQLLPDYLAPVPTTELLTKSLLKTGISGDTVKILLSLPNLDLMEQRVTKLVTELSAQWKAVTQRSAYGKHIANSWKPDTLTEDDCTNPPTSDEVERATELWLSSVRGQAVQQHNREELALLAENPVNEKDLETFRKQYVSVKSKQVNHIANKPKKPEPLAAIQLEAYNEEPTDLVLPREPLQCSLPPHPVPEAMHTEEATVCKYCNAGIAHSCQGTIQATKIAALALVERNREALVAWNNSVKDVTENNKTQHAEWAALCEKAKHTKNEELTRWRESCAQTDKHNNALKAEYVEKELTLINDKKTYDEAMKTWEEDAAILDQQLATAENSGKSCAKSLEKKRQAQELLALPCEATFTQQQVNELHTKKEWLIYVKKAAENYQEACRLHKLIEAHTAAKELLGPSGIRLALLSTAIEAVNSKLRDGNNLAGWPAVQLSSNLNLTVGGYSQLSGGMSLMANIAILWSLGNLYYAKEQLNSNSPGSPANSTVSDVRIFVDELDRLKGQALAGAWKLLDHSLIPFVVTFAGLLTSDEVPVHDAICYEMSGGESSLRWEKHLPREESQ